MLRLREQRTRADRFRRSNLQVGSAGPRLSRIRRQQRARRSNATTAPAVRRPVVPWQPQEVRRLVATASSRVGADDSIRVVAADIGFLDDEMVDGQTPTAGCNHRRRDAPPWTVLSQRRCVVLRAGGRRHDLLNDGLPAVDAQLLHDHPRRQRRNPASTPFGIELRREEVVESVNTFVVVCINKGNVLARGYNQRHWKTCDWKTASSGVGKAT